MKKKIIFLLFSVVIIFGCTPQRKSYFENFQQESFDIFLKSYKEMSHHKLNEIQKNELNKYFELELANYLDSIGIFVNWKGVIKNIKAREYDQATKIEFEIYYKPEEYRDVSFYCSHIVETQNLDSDYIYNKVKEIPEYSIVYFDGFIERDMDGKVVYEYGDLNMSYPNYKFKAIDLNLIPKIDTLPTNLKKAIDANFYFFKLLKQQYKKNITIEDFDKKAKEMNNNSIQSLLTDEEKQYFQRVVQSLLWDIMY
jgi:hypothetical protein